jgi:hypothetical protein
LLTLVSKNIRSFFLSFSFDNNSSSFGLFVLSRLSVRSHTRGSCVRAPGCIAMGTVAEGLLYGVLRCLPTHKLARFSYIFSEQYLFRIRLRQLDAELVDAIRRGAIRLLDANFVRNYKEGKMHHRQHFEQVEVQPSPFVTCDEAAALIESGTREICVLT